MIFLFMFSFLLGIIALLIANRVSRNHLLSE